MFKITKETIATLAIFGSNLTREVRRFDYGMELIYSLCSTLFNPHHILNFMLENLNFELDVLSYYGPSHG
jgi:hypothetical protein